MSHPKIAINILSEIGILRDKFKTFWHWWTEELLEILPQKIRNQFKVASKSILLELHNQTCTIRSKVADNIELVGEIDLNQKPDPEHISQRNSLTNLSDNIILLLPKQHILYKTITLPEATSKRLDSVLAFEMDRNTPFKAEDVYFSYQITKRDSVKKKIQINLAIVTRKILNDLIQQLSAQGLTISRVVPAAIAISEVDNPAKNLLPASAKNGGVADPQRTQKIKFLILILIIFSIASLSIYQRYQIVEDLSLKIETPRIQAQQVQNIRDELEQLIVSHTFIIDKKLKTPSTLQVLKSLTETLPDNTWLIRLSIKDNVIAMQGESTESSTLIALIDAAKEFNNVQFSSSVTINPRTQKERFSITAQVSSTETPQRGDS